MKRGGILEGMTSNQSGSTNEEIFNPGIEDDIDLKHIFYSLYRHKKLISGFSLAGIALATLIIINSKRVWEGQFQIVLDGGASDSSLSINSNIANLAGLSSKKDPLKTEVGILKSPSVLMNIFEFVKNKKALKNNTSIEELRFKDWKKASLSIELQKGTSILSLSYRDTDKDLVLPVLNRISSAYQDYSGKKRLRSIELGVDYFEEQIAIFKEKSINSLRKAQQFAIDEDLTVLLDEETSSIDIANSLNIETIRVKAANEIRVIDQQLEQIKNDKDQSEKIIYLGSIIPGISDLSDQLNNLDSSLASLRLSFKESDKTVKDLLKERRVIIDLLKIQAKGHLLAQKSYAQARMKAAERPEGILIEYQMLLTNAFKDKGTLDNLENKYRSLLLEKARTKDPWELITTPTLLPNPISPKKKKLLVLGLLGGMVFGSAAAYASDIRKIFYFSEMKLLGKWPLLTELSTSQKSSWDESFDLLSFGPLSNTDGGIAVIAIGNINTLLLSELTQSFQNALKNREIIVTRNLREAIKYNNLLVLTAFGITKKQEIIDIREKLLVQKKTVLGVLVLNV